MWAEPKVLLTVGQVDGCALWRVIQPATLLQARGYPVAWRLSTAPDYAQQAEAADVIVLARSYWNPQDPARERFVAAARTWQKRRALVFELDDDSVRPEALPHHQVYHPTWTAADWAEQVVALLATIATCDALTVSTEALAAVMREHVAVPVYVVPNLLWWEPWRAVWRQVPRTLPAPVIGWVGGLRVVADLEPMLEAWRRIARRHPTVRFVVAGTWPAAAWEACVDFADRIVARPWISPLQYPRQYADIDIACCPLADTPFNWCKSPCKALEAAAAGAAVVASPVVYRTVLRPGITGELATTAAEWEAALERLLTQPAYRRRLARRWAREVEQRHNLARAWPRWTMTWRQIWRQVQGEDHGRDQVGSDVAGVAAV